MRDDERAAARAPEISALLRDLDDLRLSLATDLSVAAAAVEAGCPDLARAVVQSDRAQLAEFERRALAHLGELHGSTPAAAAVPTARRRRTLLTGVTPLLATAAALLGVLAGIVPTGGADGAPGQGTQTAMASYQELTQLTREGAGAHEVARAAARLHDELAAIVAQASSDPAAAQQALALLESEARVLGSSADRVALTGVIAEARSLVARLRAALPTLADVPVRVPRLPSPTAAPDDVAATPVASPSAPVLPVPPPPRPEPSPEPSTTTEPTQEPTREPARDPSPGAGGSSRDGDSAVLPHASLPAD